MTIYFKNAYINNSSVVAGPFLIDGPLKENLMKSIMIFMMEKKHLKIVR